MWKHTPSMLSSIKVASSFRLPSVDVYNSLLNKSILKKLFKLGYIRGFITLTKPDRIRIFLRYSSGASAIRNCFLISRPSKRVFFNSKFLNHRKIRSFLEVNGFIICSTSLGILTDIESSLLGVGGEPICFIN